MIRTRERKDSKTTYGHVEFVIKNANEIQLRKLLGEEYDNAVKLIHKGIKKGVLPV